VSWPVHSYICDAMAVSEEELDARHTKELKELEAKGLAHVEAVPAGKGKVARVEAAKLEVDQWVFEMKERHAEELDELQAGGDAVPAEAAAPKVALSATDPKKADKATKEAKKAEEAKAALAEAEKVKLKQEKVRAKKQVLKDKEKAHEAELEKERRLNPPVVVPEKGKGKGYGGDGGGGGAGPCRQFAAGNCSFGDKCRFSHAPAAAASER